MNPASSPTSPQEESSRGTAWRGRWTNGYPGQYSSGNSMLNFGGNRGGRGRIYPGDCGGGRGAGRGENRGGFRGFYHRDRTTSGFSRIPANEPTPARGRLIESIHREALTVGEKDVDPRARITECEPVATYNWLDDQDHPTILTPGMPALWTPPAEPYELPQDSGVFYRDKNAARFPSHPWEPAARAVIEAHPHNDVGHVDIVCCGSTIGNLLRFVRGVDRPFQMFVDLVGQTVHLTRRESKPEETMADVRGYGHTFPDAYTTWPRDVSGSVSHQRIIRYQFAGYAVMLRYEADGYIDDNDQARRAVSERADSPDTAAAVTADDLAALMARTLYSVSQTLPKDKTVLKVRRGGSPVAQNKVFDVKTRGLWRKKEGNLLGDEMPRLWVSQTPNIIMAYHKNGRFPTEHIDVRDTREDIAAFERDNARHLTALATLLRRIVALVKRRPPGTGIEVTREAEGATIELREQVEGTGVAFSDKLRAQWEEWLGKEDKGTTPESGSPTTPVWYYSDEGDDDYAGCSAGCGYCGRPWLH